jgi:hypothetical protein
MIDDAKGFDCYTSDRYNHLRGIVNRIEYHTRHLHTLWKPILPSHMCFIAIGSIVEFICDKISDEIYLLKDIAEVESQRLFETLNLKATEALFIQEDHSLIAHYAGSAYLQFKTLTQLLTWSFATIMEHFRMGALVEFTVPQLEHLCKALFSDSELRQKNIQEIQKGHPV